MRPQSLFNVVVAIDYIYLAVICWSVHQVGKEKICRVRLCCLIKIHKLKTII